MRTPRFEIQGYWLSKREESPFYHATWFDGGSRQTRRRSLGTDDLQVAKLKLAEIAVKQTEYKESPPSVYLFVTAAVRYFEDHARHKPSAAAAKISLRLWSDFWGDTPVEGLTHKRQEEFRAWLKAKDFRGAYISRILTIGRAALNFAYKRGEVTSVPFIIDERKTSDSVKRPKLTIPQLRALLTASRQWPHLHTYIVLALTTMGRPSAVLELRPSQVSLDFRLIDLNPSGREQTKKYRPIVPLADAALPFVSDRNCERFILWRGKPIKSVKKTFALAVKLAGLPSDVVQYSLRHTMAMELRRRRVDKWETKGFLGHGANDITDGYAEFSPDYLSEGRAAIDAYLLEVGKEYLAPAFHLRATEPEGENQHVA